jgi:hypothetical protein
MRSPVSDSRPSRPRSRRLRFAAAALLGTLGASALAALPPTDADRALLAASDPFKDAPTELRLELLFSAGASGTRVPIELWRKGDELALVRFLAEKDRGKYVVRREGSFHFLAPGAKKAVKLAPALSPAGGAALDDLLAVKPSRDYTIASVESVNTLATFDLVARPNGPPLRVPKVRWVADRTTRLPVRAEFRDSADRVLRLIEFKGWRKGKRLEPERLVAKEIARGGLPLDVEIVRYEPREVPLALFDLVDGAARAALPFPALATAAPVREQAAAPKP